MRKIYFVTGNANKLQELQAIFPGDIKLLGYKLDLPEIQSMNSEEIVRDKLKRAFAAIKNPVIVDDVAAELAHLNGLPGPFIKYFEDKLGRGALWHLAKHGNDKSVIVSCTMGYYDGKTYSIVRGEVRGQVVPPRGDNGFGFDSVFVPDGHSLTTAEMTFEEKNKISHRARAAEALAQVL